MSAAPIVEKEFGRRTHLWILATVLLFEFLVFALFLHWNWKVRDYHPQMAMGEHLVIEGDGHGYYAWLRSPLIDGDFDFDDELNDHNPCKNWMPTDRTELGRRANPFSVGPALLWAPAVCLIHEARAFGIGTEWPADGYSVPYQLAVGFTAMLMAALALFCLYGICRLYARPALAALAAAFIVLGTMLINYSAIMVTWGHGSAVAVTSLMIWYWLKTYDSTGWARWLTVGALVGLAALMRWQLAVLALLPTGEFALSTLNARRNGGPMEWRLRFIKLVTAGVMSAVVFLPQLYAWKAVYGSWFVTPQHLAHHWLNPDWGKVFFASDRGFIYWTPITAVMLLGLMYGVAKYYPQVSGTSGRREPLSILLVVFALQVYFIASVIGDGAYLGKAYGIHLGSAFGFRFLAEAVVVLAPGLAILLESATPRCRRWLIAGCFSLITWNAILLAQFHFNILPKNAGGDLQTLVTNIPRTIRHGRGWIYLLMGPALLGAVSHFNRARKTKSAC